MSEQLLKLIRIFYHTTVTALHMNTRTREKGSDTGYEWKREERENEKPIINMKLYTISHHFFQVLFYTKLT